jgi:ribosomal protein S18 acetylase RimI-like enzyme
MPLDFDWLGQVEQFYRGLGLPPRFQVSDGSPRELDALLRENGYSDEAYSGVFVADAADVVEAARGGQFRTHTSNAIDERWLDAFMAVEGFAESKRATYRAIYEAIEPRAVYVRAEIDGEIAGVGMAASELGWTGMFGIATSPMHRRRGVGTHVMGVLARWSLANGAPRVYLQVMDSNDTAIRLYGGLGFSRLYGYHYRTKELG